MTTSEPDASARNQLRQNGRTSEASTTSPRRSESVATVAVVAAPAAIATSSPADLLEPVQRRPRAEQAPQQQRDDEDVGHVPRGQPERGAERLRGVGERQVADEHARPPAQPRQVERRGADADGQPDRGDGPVELQRQARPPAA